MDAGVPILTFHALSSSRSALDYPPEEFERLLAALVAAGFRSASLAEIAERAASGAEMPAHTFGLSFDDGFRSVHRHALPVVRRLGLAATLFVAPGTPEAGRRAGRLSPYLGRTRLDWPEIDELIANGFEIGAHTVHHADLTRLPAAAVREEVDRSRQLLERELDRPVGLFAYPFGRCDAASRAVVADSFTAAFTDRLALAGAGDDRWALPRVDAHYLRTPRQQRRLIDGRLGRYLGLRSVARRLRRSLGRR